MNGASAGRVGSSISKLTQHWRAKYSLGGRPQLGAEPAEAVHLLVEAVQPVRRPPAARLEEHEPQVGMALQHAEHDQLRTGEHLLEGVRHRVEEQRVERAVHAEGLDRVRRPLVDPDRHAELLGRGPHRLVRGMGDGDRPRHGFGRTNAAGKPRSRCARRSSSTAAAGSWKGSIAAPNSRVGSARSSRPASRCTPGPARPRRARVLQGPAVQPQRRVQHGGVDALVVHVDEAQPRASKPPGWASS